MIMAAARHRGPSARILILDSDASFALSLRQNLELDGYEVQIANTGSHGLLIARGLRPHLAIVGMMLHEIEGRRLVSELRLEHPNVPLLVISTRCADADDLKGFRLGTDEFVLRPASIAEVHSRIEWLLRRRPPLTDPQFPAALDESLRFGAVEILPACRTVVRGGEEVELRPKEYDLLLALARRNGRLVSRAELLRDVWGYTELVSSRTVDSHIVRLRQQLEADPHKPRHILTIRKAGYRLVR